MRIEQALYGPTRGGHSLLKATGDALIARELTSRLDLPDTAPYGVEWSSFLTGFPHGQHYVLGRTILDESASRTGMVFTHALISPLEEMASFDNLYTLIDLLCDTPCSDKDVATVEVQCQSFLGSQITPEQIAIATLLVSPGSGPVVRLGYQGFDQVVAELWRWLWPSIRRGFAFRLSFGPSDLVESPRPTLVCTPDSLAARWTGYRIANAEDAPKALLPSAALITGAQDSNDLLEYANSLGVEIRTFKDLILLERAHALRGTCSNLDNTIALLRIVEALSKGQPGFTVGKEEVAASVLRHLPNATATQALSLRNITVTGLHQPNRIWDALERWMADYKFPSTEDAEIIRILSGLDDSSFAVPEWHRAIVSGLNSAKSDRASQFAEAFWRWEDHVPYEHVFRTISLKDADEMALVMAAPDRLSSKSSQALLSLSASHRMYRLHGVVASIAFPPREAVRVQLDAQKEAVSPTGIQLALRKAGPREVVECALMFHNSQLAELAGTAASSQPNLLAEVDMVGEMAQSIWTDALRKNPACWRGPNQPEQAFKMILSAMLDGKRVETPLITALSSTPLADLNDYTRREELWKYVSGKTKERLMAATAAGWINRAADATTTALEDELQSYIVNSAMLTSTVSRFISIGLTLTLRLISHLYLLREERFLELLPVLISNALTPSDADALGKLLLVRHWSQAAERLATLLSKGREDVRPTLRVCHSLLGFWTRFRLGIAPLSTDEKWQALSQVATDLYQSGPDHDDLWRRAGGRNADLQYQGDGRARWTNALYKMRHGYGLRVSALVSEMRKDYPLNDNLRYLSRDPEFQERT